MRIAFGNCESVPVAGEPGSSFGGRFSRFVKEWRKPGKPGKFEQVEPYFEQWADRFGLFDTECPFWHCPGLVNINAKTNAERPVSVASLVHSVASGHNKTLFSHQSDSGDFYLSAAEAARALVAVQYFLPRSRHIRLLPEQGTGIEVRKMHIAQGVAWDIEPWFVKVKDLKKSEVRLPLPLNVDRAVWRNSTAYLGWRERGYFPPQNLCLYQRYWEVANTEKAWLAPVAIFALASDKAKFLTWRHETPGSPVEVVEGNAEGDTMQNTLLNEIQNVLIRLEDL